MRNDINILIAGGDMRQAYCAARLAERFGAAAAGFDSGALPASVSGLADPLPAAESYDCAVLPVVALGSDGNISTPLYSGSLAAETVASAVRDGGVIFTGREDSRLAGLFPRHRLVSYLGREELLLKNASLTAEGAVQLALERLDTALCGLPVLIVGLGRIGTALAMILRGFGADITAAVRSPQAEAKAQLLGVRSVRTDSLGGDYALVFNTSPETVFTGGNIGGFRDDTLFIELASDAGGFSAEASAKLGSRLVRANGLPGKTAPVTAGEIIADAVAAIIAEGGGGNEN
ncbi:MAG: dipicolinate synthase subunit DpsA [Ruminococcus sp.]|nr:dipicolinate synthase subunit DpsA [Ruminococcus sp.]